MKAKVIEEIPIFPGLEGKEIWGYEVHAGQVKLNRSSSPLIFNRGGELIPDGAVSENGKIFGTHLHGLFHNPEVVSAFLKYLGRNVTVKSYLRVVDENLHRLSQVMKERLDMEFIYSLARLKG